MLRTLVLAACILGSAATSLGKYNRCSNDYNSWTKSCTGKAQESPLNLCAATLDDVPFGEGGTINNYATSHEFTINTDGQVQLTPPADKASSLSRDVTKVIQKIGRCPGGAGCSAYDYDLKAIEFKFGRNKKEGSEHYIDGEQFAVEVQFVHVKRQYNTIAGAIGKADGIVIVSQLFHVDSNANNADTNAAMAAISAQIGTSTTSGKVSLKPKDLMDWSLGYYYYAGAMTTTKWGGSCEEPITWIVLRKHLVLSKATHDKLMNIRSLSGKLVSKDGNFKSPAVRGTRTIYISKGTASSTSEKAACNPNGAREPSFECLKENECNLPCKILAGVGGGLLLALLCAIAALIGMCMQPADIVYKEAPVPPPHPPSALPPQPPPSQPIAQQQPMYHREQWVVANPPSVMMEQQPVMMMDQALMLEPVYYDEPPYPSYPSVPMQQQQPFRGSAPPHYGPSYAPPV